MSLKDMFKRKTTSERLEGRRVEIEMLTLDAEKERLKAEIRMAKSKGHPEKQEGEGERKKWSPNPKHLENMLGMR